MGKQLKSRGTEPGKLFLYRSANTQKSSKANRQTIFRRAISATFASISLIVLLGGWNTVLGQKNLRRYVEAGKEIYVKVEQNVNSFKAPVVANKEIADASYRENKIFITGQSPGTTTVIFNAESGVIAAPGGAGTKPFRYRITVVVTRAAPDVRPTAENYRVSAGRGVPTRFGVLILRAIFERPELEGDNGKWRNANAESSNDSIASARPYRNPKDNGVLYVEITGHRRGRATIVLTGEQLIENTWQAVIREIKVVVTGNGPATVEELPADKDEPANDPPTDILLEGMQRRYETLKNQSERIGPDDPSHSLITQEVEQFIALVEQEIEKGNRLTNPRKERLSRLSKLRDDAQQILRQLKNQAEKDKPEAGEQGVVSLTGKWRAIFRGIETRGFRIVETKNEVKLFDPKGLLVFKGTRAGNIIEGKVALSNSDGTDSGQRLSQQLRVRPGSKQVLEVWGKPLGEGLLQEVGEFEFRQLIYVRDDR